MPIIYLNSNSSGGGLPTFTEGSVLFAGPGGVISEDNANFFWDATNNRLGLLTTTPNHTLELGENNANIQLWNNSQIRFRDNGGTERTAIYMDASNNLNVGTSAGGNLVFINGPTYTERARINNTGNFLIGTTADSARLTVVGAGTTSGTYTAQFHNSTGSNNALVIRDDGRVGIGTSAPDNALHVEQTGTFYQARIRGASPNNSGGLIIQNDSSQSLNIEVTGTTELGNPSSGIISPTGGLTKIQLGANRNTPLFTLLTATGNVGIGTTIPSARLHVVGADTLSGTNALLIENSAANQLFKVANDGTLTQSNKTAGSFFANFLPSTGSGDIRFYESLTNGHISIYMRNGSGTLVNLISSNGTTYFNGGNTIIGGTADNGNKFQVNGTANVALSLVVGQTALLANNRFGVAGAGTTAATFTAQFHNSTGSNNAFLLRDDGIALFNTLIPDATYTFNGVAVGANRVAFFKQNSSSISNFAYTVDIDSSAHISNLTLSGAFRVRTSTEAYAFAIDGLGRSGFGTNLPSARLHIVGAGATSATNALLIENSVGLNTLIINDANEIGFYGTAPVARQTINAGSTAAVLAEVVTALENLGLIIDNT